LTQSPLAVKIFPLETFGMNFKGTPTMTMLLAFAPFIAFVILERLINVPVGLAVGAAVAAILLIRDLVHPKRSIKVLEIGTVILFGGLTLYAVAADVSWSIAAVRLRVDGGLMLIVLASIALRKPFTLQYAQEQVATEHWNSTGFVHINYVISAAWAAAFAVLVLADLILTYLPLVPHSVGILITVAALVGAMKFSDWYPDYYAASHALK
jgi:hypothetical protein